MKKLRKYVYNEFLVAQRVKTLLVMWETSVRSLGQEDPLEKKLATHSRVLTWKIPWTEDPGGLQYSCLEKSHGQRRSLAGYSP